jgi:dienelactone hydrolase
MRVAALALAAAVLAAGCVGVPYETITVIEPVPTAVAPASSGPISFDSADGRTPLSGELSDPRGAPPFPAIVILHSRLCSGDAEEWAAPAFTTWGYVALMVDSYAARAMTAQSCLDFGALQPADEIGDAYGALLALEANPAVDRSRIALVGIGDGATAAMLADSGAARAANLRSGDPGFRAVFAISPFCRFRFTDPASKPYAPLRIFAGGSDEVAPAASCVALARTFNLAGGDADTIVYAGAAHGFEAGAALPAASSSADQAAVENLSACTIRIENTVTRIDPSSVRDCALTSGHVAGDPSIASELQISLKAELRALLAAPGPSAERRR